MQWPLKLMQSMSPWVHIRQTYINFYVKDTLLCFRTINYHIIQIKIYHSNFIFFERAMSDLILVLLIGPFDSNSQFTNHNFDTARRLNKKRDSAMASQVPITLRLDINNCCKKESSDVSWTLHFLCASWGLVTLGLLVIINFNLVTYTPFYMIPWEKIYQQSSKFQIIFFYLSFTTYHFTTSWPIFSFRHWTLKKYGTVLDTSSQQSFKPKTSN